MSRFLFLFVLLCNCAGQKPAASAKIVSRESSAPVELSVSQNLQQKPLPQFTWKDKRPICAVFLSSHRGVPFPGNPRNWKIDAVENFDIVKNKKAFEEAVLKHADNSIIALKNMNAQGIVLWDVEGQQFGHPISYIGDPTQTAKLAPEMDAVADQFFKKFRDAGLKVGVCLRPDTIRWDNTQKLYWHFSVPDPAGNLIRKINYAKKRWGCTMFYVDSNVYPDPVYGQLMHDSVFRKVYQAFPDCLVMPEHESQEYYKYSAPYQQMTGFRHVLNVEKQQNKDAMMVLYVPDGFAGLSDDAKVAGMKQSIQQGNILMFRNWYADPINALIKKAYQQAAK